MPSFQALKARLSGIYNNLPDDFVDESTVNKFNSIVKKLEAELSDLEVSQFLVPDTEVKQVWKKVPNKGRILTEEKYCEIRTFRTQIVGVRKYLEYRAKEQTTTGGDENKSMASSPQSIIFNGPVAGAIIQQGNDNAAKIEYKNELQTILDEIRPHLDRNELTTAQKEELWADFQTVEAQATSPNPKKGIIRESLVSVKHVIEHALGAGIAHSFPSLYLFLQHHK
jgi:hypothetical protein